MPAPKIHDLGDSFDERNVCLHATLGMISLLRRFRTVLRSHAPPETIGVAGGRRAPGCEEDILLYATLGLIAFSANVMRHLPAARTEASGLRAKQARVRSAQPRLRHAIREWLR